MNIDRWQQIKSTVALAMETPKSGRAGLIRTACGDDEDLRREVQSLVDSAQAADSLPEARAAIASAAGAMAAEQDATLRSQIESVLGHQYEIIRMLGSGGMGCVYLARERALERFVAIKVLRPDLAVTEAHRERFRREARIAARLSHPGILGLHSFGEIENIWYFVMTYVRGESLGEKIRREGLMPWSEAHRIFSEMADALDCAHRNGVVHRDIKPANILLDSESGRAILADFGISKMAGGAESLTVSGAVMGTPDYMSPEQVTGSDVDARSDIYSLGAVAYVMLTGREPFRGESPFAGMYRRVTEDPVPAEALVPSIPADLASIVRKSMARDKADRWADAASLKAALAGVISADRLPDVVRDLPSFGPYAVLWAAAWTALALLTDRSIAERALLMLVALIVPVGLMLHLWNGAGRGMRFVDLARVALWPPEWWGMWWPRALRRPTDIWDRLPWMAKSVRVLLIALVPALLLLVVLRTRITAMVGLRSQGWVEAAEWAVFIGGAFAVAVGIYWTRRKGLALDQSLRLLLGPTLASGGWEDPAITRLLAPASGKVRLPDADSPSDYVRAIREVLRLAPARDAAVTARALDAAEGLRKVIEKRDSELAVLSRDAGPGESDRLATRLDALVSGGVSETSEQAELRDLVKNQLEVVRRMQGRREVVLRDRAHLFDLMRTLWTLVRATCESTNGDAGAMYRLAALCEEIRLDPANLS
jgi:hypothetical protein